MPTPQPLIRPLGPDDLPAAMQLVWQVFLAYDAADCSDEGVEEFRSTIALPEMRARMATQQVWLWGSFDGPCITGVIATRKPCHIMLLFVDPAFHRQGIARALVEAVLQSYRSHTAEQTLTVNASLYAAEIYQKLGFTTSAEPQFLNGIRFVPMQRPL